MIITAPTKGLQAVNFIRPRSLAYEMWRWEVRDGFDRTAGVAQDEFSAKAECVAKVPELFRIHRRSPREAIVSNSSRSSRLQMKVTQHGMPYDFRWSKDGSAGKKKKKKTLNAYDALANFWGVTREEAKRRAYSVMFDAK